MKLGYPIFPALLVCSFMVSANGYVGFSFGNTSVEVDLSPVGGGTIDDTTGLGKFYGGYRLNKYVSIEGAWFSLAELSVGQVGTGTAVVSGSVDMKALGIYGVAFVPLSRNTEFYVKAGGASWDADITRDAATAAADGVDALYGLGIAYAFTRNFKGTADWEVIDSPNPEFSTLSLGFKWEFE